MREKLAYRHVLHLSIFVSRENKGSTIGKASEHASDGERETEREDSTALQPAARAHHHIIQFASISTRSSNSNSFSNRNEYE